MQDLVCCDYFRKSLIFQGCDNCNIVGGISYQQITCSLILFLKSFSDKTHLSIIAHRVKDKLTDLMYVAVPRYTFSGFYLTTDRTFFDRQPFRFPYYSVGIGP